MNGDTPSRYLPRKYELQPVNVCRLAAVDGPNQITRFEIQPVCCRTAPDFQAGAPTVVFDRPNLHDYDVTPDGNRFLVVERNVELMPTEIHVVVNWFDELNRLVPPSN